MAASLPNLAQQFSAHAFLARLPSRHHSAWRRKNVDPHPAQHPGNLAAPHINPAARPRHTLRLRNRRLVVRPVLQINPDDLVTLFLSGLEVRDVTFFLQDAGNLHLQPGSRNVHLLVPRLQRVAHPRQHICHRIGQPHRLLLLSPPVRSASRGEPAAARFPLTFSVILSETLFVSRRTSASTNPEAYQDDFETPGISPCNASWRKHKRHNPNLRRYA